MRKFLIVAAATAAVGAFAASAYADCAGHKTVAGTATTTAETAAPQTPGKPKTGS